MNHAYLHLILLTDPTRRELVSGLSGLIESEITRTRGARGMALRHVLRAADRSRPGVLPRIVSTLLPQWVELLEPHYSAWTAAGSEGSFGTYMSHHQDALARELLALVRGHVGKSRHHLARSCARFLRIEFMRPAMPRLGSLVDGCLATV